MFEQIRVYKILDERVLLLTKIECMWGCRYQMRGCLWAQDCSNPWTQNSPDIIIIDDCTSQHTQQIYMYKQRTDVYTYECTHAFVYMLESVDLSIYFTCTCVYVYVCRYTCKYVYLYLSIYKSTYLSLYVSRRAHI